MMFVIVDVFVTCKFNLPGPFTFSSFLFSLSLFVVVVVVVAAVVVVVVVSLFLNCVSFGQCSFPCWSVK